MVQLLVFGNMGVARAHKLLYVSSMILGLAGNAKSTIKLTSIGKLYVKNPINSIAIVYSIPIIHFAVRYDQVLLLSSDLFIHVIFRNLIMFDLLHPLRSLLAEALFLVTRKTRKRASASREPLALFKG